MMSIVTLYYFHTDKYYHIIEMKLVPSLLRNMTNHLFMKHIPGDILSGKHRVWPKLTPKYKRHLLRQIDQEINNMKYCSKPFIKHEESKYITEQVKKELISKQETERLEKIRANKNKIEDRFMSTHFENLRHNRVWE